MIRIFADLFSVRTLHSGRPATTPTTTSIKLINFLLLVHQFLLNKINDTFVIE